MIKSTTACNTVTAFFMDKKHYSAKNFYRSESTMLCHKWPSAKVFKLISVFNAVLALL